MWRVRSFLQRKRRFCFLILLSALMSVSADWAQSKGSPANADRQSSSDAPLEGEPPSRDSYIGDQACAYCHEAEAKTYWETAHHLTSRMPDDHSIAGKFNAGANSLRTSNPHLHYEMTATKDGYFETAIEETAAGKTMHTERIDLVIGSDRKGQTYLYWKGNRLFELPVSYWTELDAWVNSPGYPDDSPNFDRPVIPRCLECHSGWFEALPPSLNAYKRNSLVLGITCERCHGPGREHALLHRSKSTAQSPAQSGIKDSIVNPAALSRPRQMDVCAACHAGAGKEITPALTFTPGKTLDDYLYIPAVANAPIDVHGNQMQLLSRSRCYRASKMTCITCHDVHKPQRQAAAFSQHCLTCHKAEDCGQFHAMGAKIANNCIDCHMPLQESEVLVSDTNGRKIKPLVRNHQIAIYRDARVQ